MSRAPAPAVDEAAGLERYAPLVRRVALHLQARLPPSVELADLIQAGMIGLLDALRHFDGSKGASFETYAGIRIRGAMLDELRMGDWAPRSVHRRAREIAAVIREIEQKSGREAEETEIAQALGIPLSELRRQMADASQCQLLSLDEPFEDGDPRHEVPDAAPTPEQALETRDFARSLAGAIHELPERERLVLGLYYDEQLNLKEIGAVIGVSESRVCQLHGQALLRLKARLAEWTDFKAAA